MNYSIKPSKNHNDNNYHVNITIATKKPLRSLIIYAKAVRYPLGKPNEGEKIYENTINVCKILERRRAGDMIAIYVFDFVKKYFKVPRSCPIKAVSTA